MAGLSADWLDRIVIVLVRARNPNNIGAAARAMHDFGFRHLRLVNDYAVPFDRARSAVDASEVLLRAQEFPSVAAALADCTLVIGTTAVGERTLEHGLLPLPEAAARLFEELSLAGPDARAALLFGSEKTGLSNEELSHCHWLLTVPMHQYPELRHPSLNLGQAVAICLYELTRGGHLHSEARSRPEARSSAAPPSSGELERLTALLLEVLAAAEYNQHHPANSEVEPLRRTVLRMTLTREDLPVWMGILRQVLWKLRGGVRLAK